MSSIFDLDKLRAFSEDFAEKHLANYISRVGEADQHFARKEINDPIWGTIALTASEVAVLDSPLLQRLRYVKQLGVVHWLYPGAVHTRFEHTLGAIQQVQTLANAINSLASLQQISPLVDAGKLRVLRLSALLHDIGHCAFSHVGEQALGYFEEINQLSVAFAKHHRIERRQISEIVAYYIIGSPAMRDLLEKIWPKCSDLSVASGTIADEVKHTQALVQRAIIGQLIDERVPLLHELISGPFDADKLDYYARDARMAGTPSLLDISRLIQKITVRKFASRDLPDDIAKRIKNTDETTYLFGIRWSGVAVLDELHLARVLLYSKIYRHPKVVAIEQMVRSAVETIADVATTEETFRIFYELEDDALLLLKVETLTQILNAKSEASLSALKRVGEILGCIRTRSFLMKAFQLQERYPGDPLENDPQQKAGLTEFAEDLAHPDRRKPLIDEILAKISELLSLLQSYMECPRWSVDELRSRVLFNVQSKQSGGAQIGRAYLMPSNGPPVPFRDYTVNRHGWADSYASDQPQGYVFADYRVADVTFVAIEWIMRMKYDVQFCPSVAELGKRDQTKVDAIKSHLAANDVYRATPYDLRPPLLAMRSAYFAKVVSRFEAKINIYQSPEIGVSGKNALVRPGSKIRGWLKQLEKEEYLECAAKMLDAFRIIERKDTVATLRTFVEKHPSFRGATVVPFGAAKDSGVIQTYFAADLVGTEIGRCCSLEQAVEAGDRHIIFLDDFVASGGQASDILAAGFGIEALRKPLGEQRELFHDKAREHLLKNKTAFLFTAAWDDGLSAVQEIATEIGLDAIVWRFLSEKDIPFAFEGSVFSGIDEDAVAAFRQRCAQIGQALLESSKTITTDAERNKIGQRVLGYGNRAMLLASPFNVPTHTITMLWHEGKVDGIPWSPLLQRRKKN